MEFNLPSAGVGLVSGLMAVLGLLWRSGVLNWPPSPTKPKEPAPLPDAGGPLLSLLRELIEALRRSQPALGAAEPPPAQPGLDAAQVLHTFPVSATVVLRHPEIPRKME